MSRDEYKYQAPVPQAMPYLRECPWNPDPSPRNLLSTQYVKIDILFIQLFVLKKKTILTKITEIFWIPSEKNMKIRPWLQSTPVSLTQPSFFSPII